MKLKKFSFSLVAILLLVGYGYFVYAAAPSGGYNPGQILDPDCAPGDVDCVVKLQISGGGSPAGSDTQIQYNNAGAFGADALFTRDVATNTTLIANSDGANNIGGFENNNGYSAMFSANTITGDIVGITANISDSSVHIGSLNGGNGNSLSINDTSNEITLATSHATQSAVSFTGSGLDDLLFSGNFSGTYPTTYTVTVDGLNKDILFVNTSSITGGSFAVGNTITNGLGASATIDAISAFPSFGITEFVISAYTGTFNNGDTIDNGLGVTATQFNTITTKDTFTWTDGTTTVTQTTLLDSNGIVGSLSGGTGHTLTDEWTWTYSNVNQNVLDFSNNDYKFQSTFGTDTFGYQISDNLLGYGLTGSANTWTTTGGDFGINGFFTGDSGFGDNTFIQWSDGANSQYSLGKDSATMRIDYLGNKSTLNLYPTEFDLVGATSSSSYGLTLKSNVLSLGNLSGGNGTKITIDDIAQTINFNNNYSFPFADGAAGQVLGTDGSGQLGWVTVSGGGSSPTLTNGLQFIGGDIGLGGTITGNTTIDQDGYDFLVQDGENSFGLLHFPGGLISGVMHYEPGVERYGISYLDISGAKSINLSYSSETSLKSHGFTLNNDIVSMSSRSASASENFWTSIYIESNQQEIKMTGSNDLNTGNTVWQNTALSDLTGDTHADLATIRNDGTWRWNFYPNTRNDSATVTPINFLYTDALGNIFSAPKALILGTGTTAPSFSEYAAGSYNTAYTPASAFIWSATDRLFTIGNGLATGFESDAFTILKNGETGIGIDNFETNTNGNIFQVGDGSTSVIGYVDDVTGNWVNVSDERKKNNIQDLSYGLHEILQLRPTSFDYKRNGEHAIGFIAQEVLPIIPESVYGSESDGYGMSYATLTPVIVKAIQEMNLNITELTNMERPNTWRDSLIAWFGNVENGITEFIAGTIRAKTQICIDDVCMTKDQLRQVLEQNNIQNTVDLSGDIVQPDENSDTQLTPTDTPVGTSTDVPVDDSTTPTENNTDNTELTSVTSDVSAEQPSV